MAKASKRTSRKRAPRTAETHPMLSLAYSDAVRDILAHDGSFHLAGRKHSDGVWRWNGSQWSHQHFAEPKAPPAPPMAQAAEADADLAAGG